MATDSDLVDSGKSSPGRPRDETRIDFTHVVYQALLDIKEAQGEVKARLDTMDGRFDKLEARIEKLSEKTSATETKLSRIIWISTGVVGFVVAVFAVVSPLQLLRVPCRAQTEQLIRLSIPLSSAVRRSSADPCGTPLPPSAVPHSQRAGGVARWLLWKLL